MKKNIFKSVVIISLGVLLITSISGCSNTKETEENINNNTAQINEVNDNENSLVELPDGYPLKLMPLIEGYELTKVNEVSGRYQITYKVNMGLDEAREFYANLFPDALKEDNDKETIYNYNSLNDSFAINTINIKSISEQETEVFIYLEPK